MMGVKVVDEPYSIDSSSTKELPQSKQIAVTG